MSHQIKWKHAVMVLTKVELVINLSSHARRKRLMRGDDEAYCWPKCFWPLCFPLEEKPSDGGFEVEVGLGTQPHA